MSHYMTALAMRQTGLKPATKVVLYWIADHHNGETGKCFPSIKRIADLCEMSRRSVEGHIETLEKLGVLKREAQFRDTGGKSTNSYILALTGTYENTSDKQNLRMVCAKSAYGDTQNLRMNNLVSNNLVNKTNKSSNDDRVDYYFDPLWGIYPRKVGKGQAKQAFKKAIKKIEFYDLLPKLMGYVEALEGKDKQYMPHLSTWLNGERWSDEEAL